MTLDEFRKTRKITDYGYHYLAGWYIVESFNNDRDIYLTGVEEFDTLEEAEEALYQMYCDEDRLTDGY